MTSRSGTRNIEYVEETIFLAISISTGEWQISTDQLEIIRTTFTKLKFLDSILCLLQMPELTTSEHLVRKFVGYTKQQVHWEFKQPFRQEIQHPISTHGIDKLPLVYQKFHQHSSRLQEHITRVIHQCRSLI